MSLIPEGYYSAFCHYLHSNFEFCFDFMPALKTLSSKKYFLYKIASQNYMPPSSTLFTFSHLIIHN